jgi:hypothetical protein
MHWRWYTKGIGRESSLDVSSKTTSIRHTLAPSSRRYNVTLIKLTPESPSLDASFYRGRENAGSPSAPGPLPPRDDTRACRLAC